MDLGLLYPALAQGKVDVVAGNSTDGLIAALGLVVLEDDRRYFPPYEAAFVARVRVWNDERCGPLSIPSRARSLAEAMRKMNAAVDRDRRRPEDGRSRIPARGPRRP